MQSGNSVSQYVKACIFWDRITDWCDIMRVVFQNKKTKVVVLAIIAAVLVAVTVAGIWYGNQSKFHDVTIELGQEMPDISAFQTEYAIDALCRWETDAGSIDLSQPGERELTFCHGLKKETVKLNIVDTTVPSVVFQDVTAHLKSEIAADSFVASVYDLSETHIRFVTQLPNEREFGTMSVDIIVSDIYGNEVTETCTLHSVWIIPSFVLEIGQQLKMEDLLTCTEREDSILSQEWIDMINQSPVGVYTFESHYGEYSQICTVTVQDTLAPVLEIQDLTAYLGQSISAEDFINNISDGSGVYELTVSPIPDTDAVGSHTITFKAVDGSGNAVEKAVQLHIIEDNEPPVFSGINTLHTDLGEDPSYKSGVRATDDQYGNVSFSYDASSVDIMQLGTYYVTYSATDGAGNRVSVKRKVVVDPDATGPKFSGLSDMTVEKNSSPDYETGVIAHDGYDGDVAFTFDASNVDITKAGTYIITYTAQDNTGNVTTARRKVIVNVDSADVAALVAEVAAGLSADPEGIRDYVRKSIAYNSNWGGDYPVWYGLTTKTGNCYVHALCLQALLREKGIETKLIWCEDKSHYWNLVKINGEWKHMDSTPGFSLHMRYSIMNDEQRYETLSGRDWDRTAWPVCN